MNLEQRIQRLEDIEAIQQLKARYLHGCDQKQIDQIRQCFHDGEVVIDYGAIGRFTQREPFLEIYQQMACNDHIIDMHHGQNPQIDWHSETSASAIWDLFFFQINTQENTLTQLGGYYEDAYERANNQWVITSTKFHITSSHIVQMDDNTMLTLFAGSQPPTP